MVIAKFFVQIYKQFQAPLYACNVKICSYFRTAAIVKLAPTWLIYEMAVNRL